MANNQEGREAGMMTIVGSQGVGKTYLNMHIIYNYTRDKLDIKVRGRKCLIFDTNGEYTKAQFERNNIPNFEPKVIALKDIAEWSYSPVIECRRVDAKSLSTKEKRTALEYIIKHYRNGMLGLEDINTYVLSMTHMEDIVSGLVNLRHRAVDVMISYQGLRAVEPIIFRNSRWVRMHYQSDNVNDVKGKLPERQLFKISQLLVNNRYRNGDKRFYVYINIPGNKVEGDFSPAEFELACRQFVMTNRSELKEHALMHNLSQDDAVKSLINLYIQQHYGNN
jgi:hypothetical protein